MLINHRFSDRPSSGLTGWSQGALPAGDQMQVIIITGDRMIFNGSPIDNSKLNKDQNPMTKWLLVMITLSADGAPSLSQSGPFDNYQACSQAGGIVQRWIRDSNNNNNNSYTVACIASDTGKTN
ncbi:hypothetical protein ACCT19_30500 [Rhizobium ruizarguesonis]